MATEVDELIVQISADTRQLRTQLERVRRQTENTFPTGGNSPVARFAGALKGLIGPLVAVGGAMAAVTAVRGIATVADEFEALGITLDRIYDGKGRQAFADINRFAQTTPFQLEDTTKAFIALKSNGIEPSTEMLTIFGDAASAAMNPLEAFNALIRITQRAAGGGLGLEELEQLVNQGLPVYTILQEQLGVTRMEISELGKSAEGAAIIMRSLNRGLEEGFGGIMEARMELLSTKISNAQIAMKGLGDEISKHGLQSFLKDIADHFTSIATSITRILAASRTGVSTEMQELLQQEDVDPAAVLAQAEEDRRKTAEAMVNLFSRQGVFAVHRGDQLLGASPEDAQAIMAAFMRQAEDELVQLQGTARALADAGIGSFGENLRDGLQAERDALEALLKDKTYLSRLGDGQERVEALLVERIGGIEESIKTINKELDEGGEFELSINTAGVVVAARATAEEAAQAAQEAADAAAKAEQDKAEAREGLRISGQVGVAKKELEKLVDPISQFQQMLDDLDTDAFKKAFSPEQIAQLRAHFQGLVDDETAERFADQYDHLIKVIERTIDPADRLQEKLDELTAIAEGDDANLINKLFGTTDPEEIARILEKVGIELDELRAKTDETATSFAETMAPAIASLAHSFTNDFVAALTSGQNALESFRNFARNIVNQIIATFLQMAVVNQILNAIFGRFDGYQNLPTISFAKSGGGGARATGGSVNRMKPYLVGERGPELFVPKVAGAIKNSNDTRSMMGGGQPIVVNQSLNFATGVVPTVRAEVQKMLPQISDVTKASVLEATRRGGHYRRGLLGG